MIFVISSQIIPESHRANVMNLYRVPMNVITCTALLGLNLEMFAQDKRLMFLLCLALSMIGFLISNAFIKATSKTNHVVDLGNDKTERVNLLPSENEDVL